MSGQKDGHTAAHLQVTVLLFAGLRERLGADRSEQTVAAGTTVADLYAQMFPVGPQGRLPVMFALDQCYVSGTTALHDGAEVAFIPPLGGG